MLANPNYTNIFEFRTALLKMTFGSNNPKTTGVSGMPGLQPIKEWDGSARTAPHHPGESVR